MNTKPGKMCNLKKLSKNESEKLAELFRTDLISNMKIADSEQFDLADLCRVVDPWRHDWNCGVQVPINSGEEVPRPRFFRVEDLPAPGSSRETATSSSIQYDMDLMDVRWLCLLNSQLQKLGLTVLSKNTFELAMEQLELAAHGKATPDEKSPNMVDSDDTVCDVCRSPSWEDGNQIVFCDNCNVGVHQMCYGVKRIPKGPWYCRPCSLGHRPKCVLCPNRGGAMKGNRTCEKWVHVSCALWVPEIVFENKETMEPATNLAEIPESRFSLRCCLCSTRGGACIQCSHKSCRSAYHVTCAQKQGLQLISVPKFETYCLKHADISKDGEPPTTPQKNFFDAPTTSNDAKEWLTTLRPYFLQTLLHLSQYTAQSIFYYWRLKKFAEFGKPGIRLTDSDKAVKRQHEEHLIRRVQLLMFLRQNMEKARNLCYMIERREKLKRQEYVSAVENAALVYEKHEKLPSRQSNVSQPTLHLKSEHQHWSDFVQPNFFRLNPSINGNKAESENPKTTNKHQKHVAVTTKLAVNRRTALKSLDLNKLNSLKSKSKSYGSATNRGRSLKHSTNRKYDYLKRRHLNKGHVLSKAVKKRRVTRSTNGHAPHVEKDGARAVTPIDKRTRRTVVHFSPG